MISDSSAISVRHDLMYYCCGLTDKGILGHNEDAFLINKNVLNDGSISLNIEKPFIAAVSDGVGGENAGEVASQYCLKQLSKIKFSKNAALEKKIMQIHHKLLNLGKSSSETKNMQATLCGLAIDENGKLCSINVGDSRLYRFRNGIIKQLSKDQSLVQMLYDEGSITYEEKKNHLHKNIIFPAMGNNSSPPKPEIKFLEDTVEYGDIYLLCTDGLSDNLVNGEFEEILGLPISLPRRLQKLIEKALEKGSHDNITAVAICRY